MAAGPQSCELHLGAGRSVSAENRAESAGTKSEHSVLSDLPQSRMSVFCRQSWSNKRLGAVSRFGHGHGASSRGQAASNSTADSQQATAKELAEGSAQRLSFPVIWQHLKGDDSV